VETAESGAGLCRGRRLSPCRHIPRRRPDCNGAATTSTKAPTPTQAFEWASPKVTWLRELAKSVQTDGPIYEVGAWTVLKLLAVYFTLDFCRGIMAAPHKNSGKPRQGFGSVVYVDLNAGSGLVKIKGTKASLAGTALIAAGLSHKHPTRPFDYHILVEPDEAKAEALRSRLGMLLPDERFLIIKDGADQATPRILSELGARKANFVTVFDPYGFQEGTWESWGRILSERPHGDLLATFQSMLATRHTAASFAPVLAEGALGGLADKYVTSGAALDLFLESVQRQRKVVKTARVRSGFTGYFYDVIYATRLSNAGDDWSGIFDRLKANLEALRGVEMRTMLTHRTFERPLDGFPGSGTDAKSSP
jgi:hypothetical protein